MYTTPFWPAASSYPIPMMGIPLPDALSPVALDLVHRSTRLADAMQFLQQYSPHHPREEAGLLLSRPGKTVDMIEYDQPIKGFSL